MQGSSITTVDMKRASSFTTTSLNKSLKNDCIM